jgi:hypothetical protein
MNKIYSLLFGVVFAGQVFGQTYLSEDFSSGQMPPPGWTIFAFTQQFSSSPTSNAGGTAPECKITGFAYNGTLRLMSPVMNMTGVTSATLIFKHFYDHKSSPGPTIGVATKSSGSWNVVWQSNPTGNIGPEDVTVTISNSDLNKPNFQISFFVTGTIQNMDYWYFDNIVLLVPLNLDGFMSSITIPGTITSPQEVGGVFQNVGNTPVTEFDVSYQAYNGVTYDTNITGLNLGLFETFEFSFEQMWVAPFGTNDITMWLNSVNGVSDDDLSNDTTSKSITYVVNIFPRKPAFEEFTSSTCGPCASFNTSFVPWCQSHPDITLVKYQMNWPGSGDPYYTAEGGTRRGYYGVSYVPDLYVNGAQCATNIGAVQSAYDQALNLTSYIDIASEFSITGTVIEITTNLLAWENVGSVRVHNIVCEEVTTGNVSTNGETEFHHVMMDMVPDANGALVNLQFGTPVQLHYTVDLANTNVEQYNDLLLAVLVQNQSTKQMLQTTYGEEDANYSGEDRLSMIYLDGEPLEGFDPDISEYDVVLPEGTQFEPYLSVETMNSDALAIVNPAFQLPGNATIDVYAENLYNNRRYIVHYTIETGLPDQPVPFVQVYPNPATNQLFISGVRDCAVRILSIDGKVVKSFEGFSGTAIDLSGMNNGIYVLHITLPEGNVIRKKIVVQ